MPDPAGAKGVSSVESNGFFSDPDPQAVPDAVAYEFAAANAEDPLTSPVWTDAIPGFAPVAAAPTVPPRALFPVAEPEAEAVTAVAPASAFAVGIDDAAAPSMHQRSTNETTVTIAGLDLSTLLVQVIELGGSDLHMTAGARPMIRLHGHLQPVEEAPELSPTVIQTMLYAILTQRQREKFEAELELDFAYALPGQARFRVNMYRQRDAVGAAFRLIPFEIKPLEALGIPPSVANFAMMPRGFVLVTGPTGSGKSTTLAGIVDLANRSRRDHIMTVEDPIEFLHQHKS